MKTTSVSSNSSDSQSGLLIALLAVFAAVWAIASILRMLDDDSGKVVSSYGSSVLTNEKAMKKVHQQLSSTESGNSLEGNSAENMQVLVEL